nr:hypothetical protein [Tanacetum cinerariifolium]
PTPTPTTTVVAAPRLSATAKGTDEGTGSRPGVPDVPSDDSEEELSWNSFADEEGDEQTKGREESEGDKTDESDDGSGSESDKDDDDNDNEEEPAKNDDEETESEEEESFDPIPRTPEGSEDESNDEEDEELRLSEEARIQ